VARLHPSAIVDAGALLADDVEVGPYAVVGPEVELCEGVVVGPHSVIGGRTRVGARTRIHSHASLGGDPQDRAFEGEPTGLDVGEDNVIHEQVTMHVGTRRGGGCTRIGDDNVFMNTAHIGHDSQIGSHCTVASFCGIGGHVQIEDYAFLGAYTGVHQNTRVGESVMTAAGSIVVQDAPPYALVAGSRARLVGLNSVGLRRRDFSPETLRALKRAFRLLFNSSGLFQEALAQVEEEIHAVPEVEHLLSFLRKSERGFCR